MCWDVVLFDLDGTLTDSGIGVGNGYHPKVLEILPKDHKRFGNTWSAPRIGKLSNNIQKLKDLYNLEINLH